MSDKPKEPTAELSPPPGCGCWDVECFEHDSRRCDRCIDIHMPDCPTDAPKPAQKDPSKVCLPMCVGWTDHDTQTVGVTHGPGCPNAEEPSAEPVGCGECEICIQCAVAQVNAMNELRATIERLEKREADLVRQNALLFTPFDMDIKDRENTELRATVVGAEKIRELQHLLLTAAMKAAEKSDATIERLKAGLKRLASMEAFDVGTVHVPDEVIKRVDYARAILARREKEGK